MTDKLTKCDSALVVDSETSTHDWCVYEHHVVTDPAAPPQVILVGACKLTEVYNLTEGKVNSHWARIFKAGGKLLVRIVATTSDKTAAFRHASILVRQYEPQCNIHGMSLRRSRMAIKCLQNGKRYNTQTEACKDLGIPQSALSRHLNGHLRSVHGFMFIYAPPEEDSE